VTAATRVLVLRALGLGDALTAVPALRALRRALPGIAEVRVAMPASLEAVLELADVDAAVYDQRGLDGRLPPADLAVNLHGRGPQSHRLLAATGGRLVAFGNADAGHDGPVWRDDEHERERWCRLVRESFDVDADPDDMALRAPSSPAPGAVVVHPGAAAPGRRWPAERFAAVVAWAARQGHPVVITGDASEHALAQQVAELSGVDPWVVAGSTTLTQLAGLVAHARLLVVGDTGVAHLAPAYGTPSVHLMGPVSPRLWGPDVRPRDESAHRVLWHGGAGDPHAQAPDRGLLEITVDEVVAAAGQQVTSAAT